MSTIGLYVIFFLYSFCASMSPFLVRAQSRKGQSARQTGGELLQQAEQLTDIRSGNAPSFRLTARVEVYDGKNEKKEGKYTALWKSPTTWREEISFPDYSQIRLASVNKLLVSRNPLAPSEQVYQVQKLMDFSALLRLGIREQIQKLQERTKGGSAQRWVDITIAEKPSRRVHFDGTAPVPVLIEYNRAALEMQEPPYKEFDLKFQLEDYMEFRGLQFPRTLRRFESGVLKVQVQVQEWIGATYEESDFATPVDSHWIHWCPHPEPPRLQSPWMMTNLSLPAQLRLGGPPSRVVINGIIGTDGQWHNVETVKSAGSTIDSFWISQMYRQRFAPAQCGETSVEYEMMIEFRYP